MLVETNSVPLDEIEKITKNGATDYSLLTDGLVAEKEQGITIDVAYRYFRTPRGSRVLLADSPGHEQYTRNMAVAAANADIALILIDLTKGVRPQTIRHLIVSYLMGIRSFIVALNKIDQFPDSDQLADLVGSASTQLEKALSEYETQHDESDAFTLTFVPISALTGTNISASSDSSQQSLLDHIDQAVASVTRSAHGDVRLAVQSILREGDNRFYAGTLSSGTLKKNQTVTTWPSLHTATVTKIYVGMNEVDEATNGQAVAITFDRQIDLARGDLVVSEDVDALLTQTSRRHLADVVWISDQSFSSDRSYLLRIGPTSAPVTISKIVSKLQLNETDSQSLKDIGKNEIVRVEVSTAFPLLIDSYRRNRTTGGFVLCDRATGETVAAGMELHPLQSTNSVFSHDFSTTREQRERQTGFRSGVIWLTGLPSSGKSSIADELTSLLLQDGALAYVLDGDSLRQTISSDLDFSPESRSENVRRVGHIAHILMDAGVIVVVALVSPFSADRDKAKSLFADDDFVEVFVDTPLEVCMQRDPKGLYKETRTSQSNQMTGVGQNYEAPSNPDFHLDGTKAVRDNALQIREWVLRRRL